MTFVATCFDTLGLGYPEYYANQSTLVQSKAGRRSGAGPKS
jgi:hypothetical protein